MASLKIGTMRTRTFADRPTGGAMLKEALAYARRPWPVFPVYEVTDRRECACGNAACEDAGKHPRTRHGVKDATTNGATIRRWWRLWPKANVAIATGAP